MQKPRFKLSADGGWAPSQPMAETAHAAASHSDPALVGWYPSSGSADADLLADLGTIRPRARDLERNNGYVSGANQVFKDNIVGHQLRVNPGPVAALLGWSPEQAETWSRQRRVEFESWANMATEIDAAMDLNLRGLTIQALGAWFLNGEALALPLWLPRPFCKWNTRIQLIEADRLESPEFYQGKNSLRSGKEIDRYGATVAFWIRKTHDGDERFNAPGAVTDFNAFRRVPAFYPWGRRRVLHLYDKERSSQSRGKPIVASIMREFRMATQYPRVELQATIANSLVAAILESNLDQETAASLFNSGADREAYWKSSLAEWRPTLKPGATIALPIGAKFTGFTPNRPNNSFDKFMSSVLHNIGAGLNIPYELLTKDFTQTNYSSARAAMLEAWRHFMGRRSWIEENWLNPIYELHLEESVNAGIAEAPDFYENRYAYAHCAKWTMTGRGWVDPAKEALAAKTRMDARITSLAQECAEQGVDWMDVIDQTATIEAYAAEKGVKLRPEAMDKADGDTVSQLEAAIADGDAEESGDDRNPRRKRPADEEDEEA